MSASAPDSAPQPSEPTKPHGRTNHVLELSPVLILTLEQDAVLLPGMHGLLPNF